MLLVYQGKKLSLSAAGNILEILVELKILLAPTDKTWNLFGTSAGRCAAV